MQFKLSQPKLKDMIQKLMVQNIFPYIILMLKEGKIISIQREECGAAMRYVEFYPNYFEKISKDKDAVKINAKLVLKLIKQIPTSDTVFVEKKGHNLCFTFSKGTTFIPYEEPGQEFMEKLPFAFKDDIPYLKKGKIPLDTMFTIKLADLKEATKYGGILGNNDYNFLVSKNGLFVEVGYLNDLCAKHKMSVSGVFLSGKPVHNCYTFGIPEIAKTFQQAEIVVHTAPDSPALFTEVNKEIGYQLALMIPPYLIEKAT